MSVTLFGSCRIGNIHGNNNINNLLTFTHSIKEVIQLIKFIKGELIIPWPYNQFCFRTGIVKKQPILFNPVYKELYDNSNVCVIEICSEKTYICDGYYLHHLCVDRRFIEHTRHTPKEIIDTYKCIKQDIKEIEEDILLIRELIAPKKLILVTHYNSKTSTGVISSRNNLISSLISIANKHNITIINPTEVLIDYTQSQVMTSDLGHYTEFGISKITEYLNCIVHSN
jgi:hypothetical protein